MAPINHIDHVVAGFRHVYAILEEHRGDLLREGGLVGRFGDRAVRAVARPTSVYRELLRESCHPDMLSDCLERHLHLDRLWSSCEQVPWLERIVRAEQRDLWRQDHLSAQPRPLDQRRRANPRRAGGAEHARGGRTPVVPERARPLYDCMGDETVLAAAVQAGERLLGAATPMLAGVGWSTEESGGLALAGASHGGGGIAVALAALGARSALSQFLHWALAAVE